MRLSTELRHFIKDYWLKKFPKATVYLFGSRVDDNKKGGDIDLLILNDEKISLSDKTNFLSQFIINFGEQKIDLVSYNYDEDVPFKRIALQYALKL